MDESRIPATGSIKDLPGLHPERIMSDFSGIARGGRVTVIDTIYHQLPGEQPVSIDSRFGYAVTSDERPYVRKFRLGEEWIPVDVGWVEKISMLVISNEGVGFRTKQPSSEDLHDEASKVVEVAVLVQLPEQKNRTMHDPPKPPPLLPIPICEIPIGESMRMRPVDVGIFIIRCRQGTTRFVLNVIPA